MNIFGGEAVNTASYLRNRVTSRSLPPDITPYHRWFGKAPDLSHLRTFGAVCWYVLPKQKAAKLSPRAKKSILMGNSFCSKGYKLWDLNANKLVVSRDVFFPDEFTEKIERDELAPTEPENSDDTSAEGEIEPVPIELEKTNHESDKADEGSEDLQSDTLKPPSANYLGEAGASENSGNTDSIPQQPNLRRSKRKRNPRGEWWLSTFSRNDESFTNSETALISNTRVPSAYEEDAAPNKFAFWMPAIEREQGSITENNTFSIVKRDSNMKVIPCKYVFQVKKDKPKVRIVAKRFRKTLSVDYFQTFGPVVSFNAVRVFLAFVCQYDSECDQMDVVTAFLNGELEEKVYMDIPAGFMNSACLLHKALYGLKQAPRQCFSKINSFLTDNLKFVSCSYEPFLHIRHKPGETMITVLYVDDLLIAGNNRKQLNNVKNEYCRRYKMKNMGEASEFFGIQIQRERTERTLHISQTEYSNYILRRFGIENAKDCSTPM